MTCGPCCVHSLDPPEVQAERRQKLMHDLHLSDTLCDNLVTLYTPQLALAFTLRMVCRHVFFRGDEQVRDQAPGPPLGLRPKHRVQVRLECLTSSHLLLHR